MTSATTSVFSFTAQMRTTRTGQGDKVTVARCEVPAIRCTWGECHRPYIATGKYALALIVTLGLPLVRQEFSGQIPVQGEYLTAEDISVTIVSCAMQEEWRLLPDSRWVCPKCARLIQSSDMLTAIMESYPSEPSDDPGRDAASEPEPESAPPQDARTSR